MKKIAVFSRKYFFEIALFVLIIPSFISIIRPGFYSMHDDLQAFRLHQMHECIKDFQIPCRWIPDMGYQYGYPQFNFYPPSIYYLGEIFHLVGFQFIDTVKIIIILGYISAAFAMYLFLKTWLSKWPALIGALIYTYAPYKAVDTYVRGALSEFWALTFFPLFFWASYQLIKTGKYKYTAFFALSIGLLLLTHNLMTFIFIPSAVIWVFSLIIFHRKWKSLKQIILGGLLGLGIAAFFSLPLFWEKDYVHLDSIVGGYFDYRLHFVSLKQLFISDYWGYGSSVWGDDDGLSLSVGLIQWLTGLMGVLLAFLNFKKDKEKAVLGVILALLALFSLFMVHQKSSSLWSIFKFMEFIQFPWRFLGVSIFLLSILGGLLVFVAQKTKFGIILGVLIIFSLFISYGSFFKPHAWSDISDREKFSGKLWEKQLTISIFDYLPIYAKLPPVTKAPAFPEVMDGQASFFSYKKGSDFQYGEIEVTKLSNIRLPLFDFPGMRVTIDGKQVPHWHDDCRNQEFCLGLISFNVPEGKHLIRAELTNTLVRLLGNIISLISFLIILIFFLKFKKSKF